MGKKVKKRKKNVNEKGRKRRRETVVKKGGKVDSSLFGRGSSRREFPQRRAFLSHGPRAPFTVVFKNRVYFIRKNCIHSAPLKRYLTTDTW